MKWDEFKEWVAQQHVQDDDEIYGIEFIKEPDECHRQKDGSIYIDGMLRSDD